jgi:hypothetical protein
MQLFDLLKRCASIFRFSYHLKVIGARKPGPDDVANDRIVIRQEYRMPLRSGISGVAHERQ